MRLVHCLSAEENLAEKVRVVINRQGAETVEEGIGLKKAGIFFTGIEFVIGLIDENRFRQRHLDVVNPAGDWLTVNPDS